MERRTICGANGPTREHRLQRTALLLALGATTGCGASSGNAAQPESGGTSRGASTAADATTLQIPTQSSDASSGTTASPDVSALPTPTYDAWGPDGSGSSNADLSDVGAPLAQSDVSSIDASGDDSAFVEDASLAGWQL